MLTFLTTATTMCVRGGAPAPLAHLLTSPLPRTRRSKRTIDEATDGTAVKPDARRDAPKSIAERDLTEPRVFWRCFRRDPEETMHHALAQGIAFDDESELGMQVCQGEWTGDIDLSPFFERCSATCSAETCRSILERIIYAGKAVHHGTAKWLLDRCDAKKANFNGHNLLVMVLRQPVIQMSSAVVSLVEHACDGELHFNRPSDVVEDFRARHMVGRRFFVGGVDMTHRLPEVFAEKFDGYQPSEQLDLLLAHTLAIGDGYEWLLAALRKVELPFGHVREWLIPTVLRLAKDDDLDRWIEAAETDEHPPHRDADTVARARLLCTDLTAKLRARK